MTQLINIPGSPLSTLHSPRYTLLILLHSVEDSGWARQHGPCCLLVRHLLLVGDREAVDAEVVANARRDEVRPAEVGDTRKDKIGPQVHQLNFRRHGREAEARKIAENSSADQRPQHDGPVREGLAGEMGEDHLGGHPAKDEAHDDAEQDQVVVRADGRVRAECPGANAEREDGHGRPLEEDRQDGLVARLPRLDDIVDAKRNVPNEKRAGDEGDPDVAEAEISKELRRHPQRADNVHAAGKDIDQALRPNSRAAVAANRHNRAGDQDALGRSVEVSKIQGVRMVRLPGREEHGKAGDEGREDARLRGSQAHSPHFQKTSKCAVQAVDAVVEQFAQPARGTGPSRLLAVDIVHRLVHEESEGEAVV